MLHNDLNDNDRPSSLKLTEEALLECVYRDVVAFEKKLRSSFGAEFARLLSDQQRDAFGLQLVALIGESSAEAKLAYVRLVNDVLAEIEQQFPVKDLQVFWPSTGAARKAAFLLRHDCDCLSAVAGQASNRLHRSGPFANKPKF